MRYMLIFLMTLLVGCGRQVTVETQDLVIEPIIETNQNYVPVNAPLIVIHPIIGAYCTESAVKSIFKDSVAIKKDNIHFADGKLKYINFYLLMDFSKKYNAYRIQNGFERWRVNFDCDDFAQMFMIFLKMHVVLADEKKITDSLEPTETFLDSIVESTFDPYRPEGIAVGEVWYEKAEGDRTFKHAINLIFLGPNNYLFIEPQDCQILELTDDEKKSIYFIRF